MRLIDNRLFTISNYHQIHVRLLTQNESTKGSEHYWETSPIEMIHECLIPKGKHGSRGEARR